jgi:transposase-like protein
MRRWERDWDVITPIFKFSADVRTVIYTTYTDKKTMPIFHRKPDKQGSPREYESFSVKME